MTQNKRRVVVTGLGPVSPIAVGRKDYWQALREGRNGIHSITTFDLGDCPVTFGAEIRETLLCTCPARRPSVRTELYSSQ